MSNRKIWDAWGKTDPEATKQVSAGRRHFTAIDAYYKIEKLTEQFGPAGKGWGWTVHAYEVVKAGDDTLVLCRLTLWWQDGDETRMFPDGAGTVGCAHLVRKGRDDKGRVDSDAWKKAQTDALTKAASFLGLGHDVFRGRFDDSKYVHEAALENSVANQEKKAHLDRKAATRATLELGTFLREQRVPEDKVVATIKEVEAKPLAQRAVHARALLLKAKNKFGQASADAAAPAGKRPF